MTMRRHSFNLPFALLGEEETICQLLTLNRSSNMKTMLMTLLLLSLSLLLSTNNSILSVNGFVLEPATTTTRRRSCNLLVNARGGACKTTSLMMLRPTSKKIRQQLYDHQSSDNDNNKNNKKIFHFMEIPRGGGGGGESNSSVENNNEDEDANASSQQQQQQFQGRALLCLVAVLYGTLNVSLRLVYQLPDPPSASVLSATRGWLATGCFVPLLALNNNNDNNKQKISSNDDDEDKSSSTTTAPTLLEEGGGSGNNDNNLQQFWLAGFELAVWNFLAQGLLNIGLLSTGSARASFLTQTSVVMTPIISFLFGQVVPWTVWVGCCIALGGLTLLSGGGGAAADVVGSVSSSSSMLSFSQGDWWVLGGAFSWSLYLFRLSKIGSKFQEVQLQATKTFLLAILYSIWVISSFVGSSGGGGGTTIIFGSWSTNLIAWLTLLYSALGPGTIADILQQQGQKFVSASEANVLLSMEPVFAAICAWLLLGEVSTTKELIGGAMILVAALVATTSPSSSSTTTETETTEN